MKRILSAALLGGMLVVTPGHAVAYNDAVPEPASPQQVAVRLADSPGQAGRWIDHGRLMVAVTNESAAAQVRAAGAVPQYVTRSRQQLDSLLAQVDRIARSQHGLQSWGIDPVTNSVVVKARSTTSAFAALGEGVRVVRVSSDFHQQSGVVHPGDPWWPGAESNCSVAFPATDAQGNKHFLTAGHCTNDANQAAYGASGQANRIGTSNVGGTRSVNAQEGDMGVVAVTEPGWTISPNVNTWGQPAVTVTGSAEAIVGDTVCHSGNTAPNWECGTVTAVNQTIDYGTVVIDGLTTTTACSEGGDSGGAWLRGDKAVGVHSGGNSTCSPGQDNSIFQPVNEALAKWNLTLLTGSSDPGDPGPGERTYSNGTDYPIRDFQVAVSSVQSTATGRTNSPVKVTVEGNHTCLEDLNISLVSPSGRWYYLQRSGGTTCHPLPASKTYSVAADESATGTWTLRIGDNGYGDTGTLTNWSITV
ncbi:proprotein convertase P-domain-containing protein [Kribbella kalugense]|uniref:Streptogrisin C n=1 Tax=Kribbella kalugense TaxID=2512221 RepID=A0A4R7ZCE0_9ACTN|nr:proprotein convertase P-domain-containing protein [Kribbella kalugense]TDW15227.1 streptogrisin C [Kribbella kalugense]